MSGANQGTRGCRLQTMLARNVRRELQGALRRKMPDSACSARARLPSTSWTSSSTSRSRMFSSKLTSLATWHQRDDFRVVWVGLKQSKQLSEF